MARRVPGYHETGTRRVPKFHETVTAPPSGVSIPVIMNQLRNQGIS